ncbi:Uncharacterised protein [Acinetobacter baumannii]|nr:Uncharacterised protein [Acinetobacter baumannii]
MYCKQVACTLLVLNAMNHAVLTTSYVDVRAVRVTLVFLVSIYLLKMTSCVFSQVTVSLP